MDVDLELVRLASGQRGLVTKQQVLNAGGSAGVIKWRLRAQQWHLLRRNVYQFAGSPATWEQAVLAAVLSCGDGFVASHESALRLYGGRAEDDAPIEVSAERRQRTEAPGLRSHRSFVFFDADVSFRAGIPVTSAARTVVDLSSRRSAAELGAIADDLQRRGLLRTVQLVQCASRLRSAPGRSMATVHDALAKRWAGYDPGDSDLESRIVRALHAARLPLPMQQVRVQIGGRRVYLDLAYPELKLAIEIDSWTYHRFRSAFDADRIKANELVLLGWTVLRVTDAMPDDDIVMLVRRALEALGEFRAS